MLKYPSRQQNRRGNQFQAFLQFGPLMSHPNRHKKSRHHRFMRVHAPHQKIVKCEFGPPSRGDSQRRDARQWVAERRGDANRAVAIAVRPFRKFACWLIGEVRIWNPRCRQNARWSGAKWTYHLPFLGPLESYRVFEMPLVGLLGFPLFALECWLMFQTAVLVLEMCGIRLNEPLLDAYSVL